ncbi:MAG: hypothetical protein D3903_06515, partial [Candidatus Electrothrix sp. GM3_4]|nr:hypothetical protein [Candidatus Electrothrix sp. GM3_4]
MFILYLFIMRFRCGYSVYFLFVACLLFLFVATGQAKPTPATSTTLTIPVKDGQIINLQQQKYKKLFQELEQEHKFQPAELERTFQGQKISKRVLDLMDKQWKRRPYYEYFPL